MTGILTDRPTIAVVDDDAAVRAALQRLLLSMNMPASAFASAEDFLASADPRAFDCLLLDVDLGGMSGLELSARLAAERVDLPIILLTAQLDVVACGSAGRARTVLHKPVEAEVLALAVEQTLAVVATTAG